MTERQRQRAQDGQSELVDDILDGWEPGRTAEKRAQQRAAGRATLEFLAERGAATAAEFRRQVEPEHPVDGQSRATWWRNTGKAALKRAREAGVVEFRSGIDDWHWIGEETYC